MVHVEPPLRGVVYFSTPISSGSAFRQAALLSGLSHTFDWAWYICGLFDADSGRPSAPGPFQRGRFNFFRAFSTFSRVTQPST